MKKILIIGGSFDPIHNGHLSIATQAQKMLKTDEVWFLPLKSPRWKNIKTAQNDRINMLKLAIKSKKCFKYCDYEIKNGKPNTPTYTVDTIKALNEKYPDYQFYFLIGTDQVEQLPNWKDIDTLAKIMRFVLVNRPGYQDQQVLIKRYHILPLNITGPLTSSSLVRMFASNDVPKMVANYIAQHGLYLENKLAVDLNEERFQHSKRVAALAKNIAKANQYDVQKAYIAGILHDCAKDIPLKEAKQMMQKWFPQCSDFPPQVYHQYLGYIVAQETYHIKDKTILKAIKYHATACDKMQKLDKIIYVSDKIEPGRNYDSSHLISACVKNINEGFKYVLAKNFYFLQNHHKNRPLHALTQSAFDKYVKGGKYDQTEINLKNHR